MADVWVKDVTGEEHEVRVDHTGGIVKAKHAVSDVLCHATDSFDLYYEGELLDRDTLETVGSEAHLEIRASRRAVAQRTLNELSVPCNLPTLMQKLDNEETEAAVLLLEAGIDLTGVEANLLQTATMRNLLPVMKALLETNGLVTESPGGGLHAFSIHYVMSPEAVDLLVAHGADVNAKTTNIAVQNVPLTYAAGRGALPTVKALLAHGADASEVVLASIPVMIGDMDRTQEELVSIFECIKHLLASGASMDHPAFPALLTPAPAFLRFFLSQGADPNCTFDDTECPFLMSAAAANKLDAAQVLVEYGADVNKQCTEGRSALHVAMWYRAREVVVYLVEQGADINCRTKEGQQPIHMASSQCSFVDFALEAGGDPNTRDANGLTPLHLAASGIVESECEKQLDGEALVALGKLAPSDCYHIDSSGPSASYMMKGDVKHSVQALVAAGADINATCKHGYTPLHLAAAQGHAEWFSILLSCKADPNIQCKGKTPRALAQQFKHSL